MAIVGYVVACVATLRLTDHHVRPLFEGIGPAPPYRWVDPPPEFAGGNVPPEGARRELPLGPAGSSLTSLTSGDAQTVVNRPASALPPADGQTIAALPFAPLAPKDLPPPGGGLVAAGNAYRISISYGPSGQSVDKVAKPGNIVMALPHPGVTILWSADGKGWQRLDTVEVGAATTLGTRFDRPGYYLGASTPVPPSEENGTGQVVLLVAIIAGLALAIGFLPVLVRRIVSRGESDPQPEDVGSGRVPKESPSPPPTTKRHRRRKR